MDMTHQVIIDIQVRPINTARSRISSYPISYDTSISSIAVSEEEALKIKTEITGIIRYILCGRPY